MVYPPRARNGEPRGGEHADLEGGGVILEALLADLEQFERLVDVLQPRTRDQDLVLVAIGRVEDVLVKMMQPQSCGLALSPFPSVL